MKWGFLGAMREMARIVMTGKGGSVQLVDSWEHVLNSEATGLLCGRTTTEPKKYYFKKKP